MSNRETRLPLESVHLYLALARTKDGQKAGCIRTIDKGNENELDILTAKLKVIGGTWRIHRTVNARNVEKARVWLLHDLIDHPEHASYIDAQWRTALLQPECAIDKKFMLDIDSADSELLNEVDKFCSGVLLDVVKSPQGYHYITKPFDTRDVCKFPNVSLIRDGYYYVKTVSSEGE